MNKKKQVKKKTLSHKGRRTKGHSFERWVANEFKFIFPEARRKLEYQKEEAEGVDIANTGFLKVQCKKLRQYSPVSALKEVKCDREFGEVPVLVTAGDNQEALAVLPFNEFLLITCIYVKLGKLIIQSGLTEKQVLDKLRE